MCVFKNHAFIYFLRPPTWCSYIFKTVNVTSDDVFSQNIAVQPKSSNAWLTKNFLFFKLSCFPLRFARQWWSSVSENLPMSSLVGTFLGTPNSSAWPFKNNWKSHPFFYFCTVPKVGQIDWVYRSFLRKNYPVSGRIDLSILKTKAFC